MKKFLCWFSYVVGGIIGATIGDVIVPVDGMTLQIKLIKTVVIGIIVGTIVYMWLKKHNREGV